jgi:hypothetical protein
MRTIAKVFSKTPAIVGGIAAVLTALYGISELYSGADVPPKPKPNPAPGQYVECSPSFKAASVSAGDGITIACGNTISVEGAKK